MEPLEIKPEASKKHLISKTQGVFLAAILILAAMFVLDRQFGWLGVFYREPVAISSSAPYAEAAVVGFDGQSIVAERILPPDAGEAELALPKKIEILADEKTIFAEMTSSGPVKISKDELAEGDVVWIYSRVRSLEEVLKAPADPDLAVPFEEMLKNPRERIKADFVVKVGK